MASAHCVSYNQVFRHGAAGVAHLKLTDPAGFTWKAGGPGAYAAPAAGEHGVPPLSLPVSSSVAPLPSLLAVATPFTLRREGLEGVEPASSALIAKVAAKRNLHLAHTEDELRYLAFIGAEANVGGENMDHILVKDPPGKAALLEEFLHGTQYRLGIIKGSGDIAFAEWHVKDFMVRHSKLLGLGEEDVAILKTLRDRDYNILKGIS